MLAAARVIVEDFRKSRRVVAMAIPLSGRIAEFPSTCEVEGSSCNKRSARRDAQ
jgi:hypothetical protein